MPSSIMAPQRLQYTLRSSKQSPMPSGNHRTAARMPGGAQQAHHSQQPAQRKTRETGTGKRGTLTEEAVLGRGDMPAFLEAEHLGMVWGQEGHDALACRGVHVVVYDRAANVLHGPGRACGRASGLVGARVGEEGGHLHVAALRCALRHEGCCKTDGTQGTARREIERRRTVLPYCSIV